MTRPHITAVGQFHGFDVLLLLCRVRVETVFASTQKRLASFGALTCPCRTSRSIALVE